MQPNQSSWCRCQGVTVLPSISGNYIVLSRLAKETTGQTNARVRTLMSPSLSMCWNPNTKGDGIRNQERRTSRKLLDYMDGPLMMEINIHKNPEALTRVKVQVKVPSAHQEKSPSHHGHGLLSLSNWENYLLPKSRKLVVRILLKQCKWTSTPISQDPGKYKQQCSPGKPHSKRLFEWNGSRQIA